MTGGRDDKMTVFLFLPSSLHPFLFLSLSFHPKEPS